ncbi:MAG TPA: cupin domain-containing protein [Pirellulaceae bacterium]|nr:cupin domain-containing protein [Pirellulaceae bacterium]HMO93032.1 cupin domain-containing protein [Pirellulaceae bacterium]HMP69662.1 cupin domain-containing protein [Pirellulaceae bacterium]
MHVANARSIEQKQVDMEGAMGCHVRILVGEKQSAPNFVMRQFSVEPGGHTPRHFHDYEHEVYVLSGKGQVLDGDQWHTIQPGDVVYVAPNDVHQFVNAGDTNFEFLCLIPSSAVGKNVTVVPECGLESR